jgi:hypothetical protein
MVQASKDESRMSKRRYKRMSPTEWAEARALWETGEVTLQELAVRFGVTERALQAHFKKSSIVKGCKAKEMAAAVQQAVFADIFEDPAITRAKEREARAAAYENATKIEKLIMGQLAEAQKDPANAHRASSALRALAIASQALERVHSMKWASLGLDKLDDAQELTELPMIDYTEKELDEIRRKQRQEYANERESQEEEMDA